MLQRMERGESVSTDGDECPGEDARKGKKEFYIRLQVHGHVSPNTQGARNIKGGNRKKEKKNIIMSKRDFLARERDCLLDMFECMKA